MGSCKTHDPVWFNTYWPPFRRHVHELLTWGYEGAKSRIMQNHEEEEITGFITEAIQNRLVTSDCPRWCERYALKENNPVPGKGLTGKQEMKSPFIIFFSIADPALVSPKAVKRRVATKNSHL